MKTENPPFEAGEMWKLMKSYFGARRVRGHPRAVEHEGSIIAVRSDKKGAVNVYTQVVRKLFLLQALLPIIREKSEGRFLSCIQNGF